MEGSIDLISRTRLPLRSGFMMYVFVMMYL